MKKLVTYESGGHKTVIDYILVKKEKVKNVKAIPGEESNDATSFDSRDILFRKACRERKEKTNRIKIWRLNKRNTQKNWQIRPQMHSLKI